MVLNKIKFRYFILLIAISLMSGLSYCSEKKPVFDKEKINAHGGQIIFEHGNYYLVGEYREGTNTPTKKVALYMSKDLNNWSFSKIILNKSNYPGYYNIERPKLIFNNSTKKFILWYHLEKNKDFRTAEAGVAISDSIDGNYKVIKEFRPKYFKEPVSSDGNNLKIEAVRNSNWKYNKGKTEGQTFRDFNLFKDHDGKAYIIYSSENNFSLQIALLDKNYTSFTDDFSRVFVGRKTEAPILIKKDDNYYIFCSDLNGYKPTNTKYGVSKNIFGPYNFLGNPIKGEGKENTFSSQISSAYFFNGIYYILADIWERKDLSKSGYRTLKIYWENNIPYITDY